jgi:hypothetical protein
LLTAQQGAPLCAFVVSRAREYQICASEVKGAIQKT